MNLAAINTITKGNTKTSGITPFMELDIDKVYANPNQPRKNFEDIEDLAASIKENGLIQPIAVVNDGAGMFMIVSGERRFRATKSINGRTIKSHILQADNSKVQELSLVENIQRSDLTDLEIAKYISILWNSGQYAKKADLAKAIGKSASYISKAFSCLKLDSEIIKDIEANDNDLPLSVLEEISRLKDKDIQKEVYEKYVAGEIIRDDIKDFKPMVENKTNKKETEKEISLGKEKKQKLVCYGFGTQNEMGTYISINDGDLSATLLIAAGKDLIVHSNNNNYKITIEEI